MSDAVENEEQTVEISGFEFSWKVFIPWISLVAIALGQINDTWDGVLKIWEFGQSTMSDEPSRNRLNKIYINADSGILEETLGSPVYTKQLQNGDIVTYYKDRNFILSAISKDNIIAAFLVFPQEGFTPNTSEHAGGTIYIGMPFDKSTEFVDSYLNVARIGSYYIEEISGGKFDLLYSSVGGVSEYLGQFSPKQSETLTELNSQMLLGEDYQETLKTLRHQFTPNFFGYSSIGTEELEQAILTYLEYELLTNKIG